MSRKVLYSLWNSLWGYWRYLRKNCQSPSRWGIRC